ncbi:MAG: hypothetical protein GVY15_00090 [Bacteroidetes bacterium]|jgi:hypothetical protein|nr:hypothetical protein [Bacteroidota bacterium]
MTDSPSRAQRPTSHPKKQWDRWLLIGFTVLILVLAGFMALELIGLW